MICDTRCVLYWRVFLAHLRRWCALLHLDGVFWRYQWDLSHLRHHLRPVFLTNFPSWCSVHWREWGVRVSYCYCVTINFSLYVCYERNQDINRWRDIPYSWVGIINSMKMTIPPNAIYRFKAILIKLPTVITNGDFPEN